MLLKIQEILSDSAIGVLIFSIILCLIRIKRVKFLFKILLAFLILNLLTELVADYFWRRKMNNLPLLHLYTLFEFVLLSWFYKIVLRENKWIQKYFWSFIFFISVLVISNSIFLQSIYGFNSNAKTLVQLILISYAVIYIYSYSLKLEEVNENTKAIRLINAAILIYHSSSLFIFLFSNMFLINDIKIHKGFWVVNAGLNLIFQVLILIAIWKVVFKQTKSI
ncbi:MAG: hypothetical protein ACJAT4_001411 [Granulosicoccus sp.]